jgi:hypothetical protein
MPIATTTKISVRIPLAGSSAVETVDCGGEFLWRAAKHKNVAPVTSYRVTMGGRVVGRHSLSRYTAEQMFGFGFTSRVIECYLAVISSWQPSDRIYLFGFSRGAYTARCVAHVLDLCGIPTKQPGSDSLSFEPRMRSLDGVYSR